MSEIKLSKIERYSASFEFFVTFPFPDLELCKVREVVNKEHYIPCSQKHDD